MPPQSKPASVKHFTKPSLSVGLAPRAFQAAFTSIAIPQE